MRTMPALSEKTLTSQSSPAAFRVSATSSVAPRM